MAASAFNTYQIFVPQSEGQFRHRSCRFDRFRLAILKKKRRFSVNGCFNGTYDNLAIGTSNWECNGAVLSDKVFCSTDQVLSNFIKTTGSRWHKMFEYVPMKNGWTKSLIGTLNRSIAQLSFRNQEEWEK